MDDGLEGAALACSARPCVSWMLARSPRAGARHGTHCLLSAALLARMQDDVMAQCHQALRGAPSKAISGARYEHTDHDYSPFS